LQSPPAWTTPRNWNAPRNWRDFQIL